LDSNASRILSERVNRRANDTYSPVRSKENDQRQAIKEFHYEGRKVMGGL